MANNPITVLIIEDNPGDSRLIREILIEDGRQPFRLEYAESFSEGLNCLTEETDIVLLDLSLPDSQGLDTFRMMYKKSPGIPIIILTGLDDETVAVNTVQEGAQDYLPKSELSGNLLRRSIQYAIERKRVEQELKSFASKLEQSNRELQDFANVASHDLQEPLRKVTTFCDRLKTKYSSSLDEQGNDYIERMQSAAERMQLLIDDLLTFSRVTTKAHPFIPTDLSTVAGEVAADLEVRIEQSKGRVEIGDLPTIDADPLQMRQLLQNLICNALKFSKRGEAPVVRVYGMFSNEKEPAGRGDYFQLTVEDNGIGFDEQYADRIFGVFQRLHGRNEYEGTGIGLSVCKKIIERHGGSVTARSRPGCGASFTVTLPVRQTVGEEAT